MLKMILLCLGIVLVGTACTENNNIDIDILGPSDALVDESNFAVYVNDLGDYATDVSLITANKKVKLAVMGKLFNDSQLYYMTANGYSEDQVDSTSEKYDENIYNEIYGMIIVKGYKMPDELLEALGYGEDVKESVAVYEIKDDSYIGKYEKENKFTTVNGGTPNPFETHYVTSNGTVFILPGFPRTQEDGTVNYYITPNDYYTISEGEEPYTNSIFKETVQVSVLDGEIKTSVESL